MFCTEQLDKANIFCLIVKFFEHLPIEIYIVFYREQYMHANASRRAYQLVPSPFLSFPGSIYFHLFLFTVKETGEAERGSGHVFRVLVGGYIA